jgi:hypothetical protein
MQPNHNSTPASPRPRFLSALARRLCRFTFPLPAPSPSVVTHILKYHPLRQPKPANFALFVKARALRAALHFSPSFTSSRHRRSALATTRATLLKPLSPQSAFLPSPRRFSPARPQNPRPRLRSRALLPLASFRLPTYLDDAHPTRFRLSRHPSFRYLPSAPSRLLSPINARLTSFHSYSQSATPLQASRLSSFLSSRRAVRSPRT